MMQLPGRFLPLQAIKCRAAGQGKMGAAEGRAKADATERVPPWENPWWATVPGGRKV